MKSSVSLTTSAAAEPPAPAAAGASDPVAAFEALLVPAILAPVTAALGPLGATFGDAVARALISRDGVPGESGSMKAGPDRDAAIAKLLPLVGTIVRGLMRVYNCGEYADVFQDGCLGMVRAVASYEPDRGVPLEPYARQIIAGAVLNGIRNRDPLSEHARKLLREAERERDAAAQAGREEPTLAQMSTRLSGLGAAMLMAHRANTLSLDEPLPRGETIAPDWTEDPARVVEEREDRQRLRAAIEALTDRQRSVISSYYFKQQTVQAVSEELAVSTQRVSQLHQTAISHMRKQLVAQ